MERQHAVVGKRLRFARRELEGGEVDHLVAARVELFLRRLSRVGGVKRKEEHAALGAELLLVARRMPACAEAFGREDDECSAGLGDGVADGFLKRAHESRDACAARADARGFGENRRGLLGVDCGCAMAFESVQHGRVQDCEIAVAIPFPPQEFDFTNRLKIAGVDATRPRAGGVFFDVASKGGELPGFLDDPIVPVFFENRVCRPEVADAAATRKTLRGRVLRRRAAPLRDSPIFVRKIARKLPDECRERFPLVNGFDLDQQVKMVGHDDKGRYLVKAAPLLVEGFDDGSEGAREIVFDQAVGPDLRKRFKALDSLQGHHVEVGRFVVEAEEPSHGLIIAESDGRRHRVQNSFGSGRGGE